MEKIKFYVALCIMIICYSEQVCAFTFSKDSIYYNVTDPQKNEVEVTWGQIHESGKYISKYYNRDVVTIPSQVTKFMEGKGLVTYTVKSVGKHAFQDSPVKTVVLPSTITYIDEYAFCNCEYLQNIDIPNSVKSIKNYVFQGTEITDINIPASIIDFGKGIFPNTIRNITLGHTIKQWCECTFAHRFDQANTTFFNLNVESVIIEGKNIADRLELTDDVRTVSANAFSGLPTKTLVINTNIAQIDSAAFPICKKVIWKCNKFPKGYEYALGIQNYISENIDPNGNPVGVFDNATNSWEYTMNQGAGEKHYIVEYGQLSSRFTVGGITYVPVSVSERICDVIDCTYDKKEESAIVGSTVTAPNGATLNVRAIRRYACYSNHYFKSAQISHNSSIDEYAFFDNINLTYANISNKAQIERYAFGGASSLKELTVSNNGYIGEGAFANSGNEMTGKILNKGDIRKQAFLQTKFANTEIFNDGDILDKAFVSSTFSELLIENKGLIDTLAFSTSKSSKLTVKNTGCILPNAFSGIWCFGNATVMNTGEIYPYAFYSSQINSTLYVGNEGNIEERAFQRGSYMSVTIANTKNVGEYAFYKSKINGKLVLTQVLRSKLF